MAAQGATEKVPWSAIREAPVVLVSGPESFLADRAIRVLVERLRSVNPELETVELDAAVASSGELIQAVSPSLFGEPRLVRVQNAEKMTEGILQDALDYLEHPDPNVTLVIRHASGVRGKKLLDTVRAHGKGWLEVVCSEVTSDRDRSQFARLEAKSLRVVLEADAERMLLDAFSTDLAELSAAIAQLASDVGEGGKLSGALVARYYQGRVEMGSFDVAEEALRGAHGAALAALRHALHTGVEPVLIVSAFAHSLRTMARVGGLRGTPDDIARQTGLKPWQIQRARANLQGWDEVGLGLAIREVAHTDASIKGLGHAPEWQLEKMVTTVALKGQVSSGR